MDQGLKLLPSPPSTGQRTGRRGNNMLPATVKDQFIDLLVETGNVSNAARRLGINRMTAYAWRNDIEYAQKWEIALDIARQGLNERVVDTACAMGVGEWVPSVDPDTNEPLLDDDFEPFMHFETRHVDARVLMKLMDKTMQNEVHRIEQRTAVAGYVEHEHRNVEVVVYSPDGKVMEMGKEGQYHEVSDPVCG